jgi:hypothetical protein
MTRSSAVAVTLGLLTLACSATPSPVPITGDPADVAALAGEWAGEYHAYDPHGRSGTLFFRLDAGADTAQGDVLMHIAGRETAGTIPIDDPWRGVAEDRILTITFVRAAGGSVFGRLDPYNDPVCGCEMRTTFMGRIDGNLIEGTYTSEHLSGGDRTDGSWRVSRRPRR